MHQSAPPPAMISCIRADNPSPMTGQGTNSYVIRGPQGVVVIDPGPELEAHFAALVTAIGTARVAAILVTHAHLDHSALAPRLARHTGAPLLASGRASEGRSAIMTRLAQAGLTSGGEGIDTHFAPDRNLIDGEMLELAGLRIETIATPGHMAGHLSFGLGADLFSGDHVMGWSSSLVSPPDGDMGDYVKSLQKLGKRPWQRFFPGHGAEISNPATRLAELIEHRRSREAEILAALAEAPATAATLAALIYTSTHSSLLPAASRNVLAHLIDLHDRKEILSLDPISTEARFKLFLQK